MVSEIPCQLASPPAPNPLGRDIFQIIERTYSPSSTPGRPPVLERIVEGPWRKF